MDNAKQAQMIVDAATAFGYKSTKALLNHLLPGSERLLDVTQTFSVLASEEKLNVVCFFEQLRTPIIRKLPKLLRWVSQSVVVEIVSETSACLDGYRPVGLNSTHTKMNEFSSPEDGNYQLVSGKVLDFVSKSTDVLEARSRPRSQVEALFVVPHLQNPNFVDRGSILKDVLDKMAFKRGVQTRVGLWGLGGVGKSQIATRYAYSAREEHSAEGVSVFWIHAATRARFEHSYMKVSERANISGSEALSVDKLQLVTDWLGNEKNGRWIMIVDNADDINLFNNIYVEGEAEAEAEAKKHNLGFSSYIPRCDHGAILFTSRSKNACLDLTGSNSSMIHVTDMSPHECELLLRRSLQDYQIDGEMHALFSLLEHLPLALAQAAAFMCRSTMTISGYVELYKESENNRMELLSQEFIADGRDSVSNAIAATWAISFNRMKEREPQAALLLSIMSFFDRQDIPKALLPRGECTAVQFEIAIGTLQAYSMITPSQNEKAYDMHALVQLSTRHWLHSNNETEGFIKQVLSILANQFPVPEFQNWSDCARYLPHSQSILGHAQDKQIEGTDEVVLLLNTAAYFFLQSHNADAEILQLCAMDISRRVYGAEHVATVKSMSDLALTYIESGRWGDAEALQLNALDIVKKTLGSRHRLDLTITGNLALAYTRQGRLKDAEALEHETLERRIHEDGPEHPRTLHAMHNLSVTYFTQGDMENAETLCARVVDKRTAKLGPDHPNTLRSIHCLANIYSEQGRFEDAEVLSVEVLDKRKRTLRAGHPDILSSMSGLATTYANQGRFKEAEILLVDALDKQKTSLRIGHPNILQSMSVLAGIYTGLGRWKDAELLFLDVLDQQKKALWIDHPDILRNMASLACIYDIQGRSKDAEILFVEVLDKQKRNLGLEHPETQLSMFALACVRYRQGGHGDAIILMAEIVRLRRQRLGTMHPLTKQSIDTLEGWEKELKGGDAGRIK